MIRSKELKGRMLPGYGHAVVWETTFKDRIFYTSCGVGAPGLGFAHGSEATRLGRTSRRRDVSPEDLQYRQVVFVPTRFAVGISIHSALSAATPREAIFFLCASHMVQADVIAALNVVAK